MTATLDLKLAEQQLPAKLSGAALDLLLQSKDRLALTLQLDVMVLGRLESRTLAWARDRSGNLGRPCRVRRDAELGSAAVTRAAETIVEVCEEWVELGGDVLDPGVDLGTSLTDDAKDLLASLSS